MRVETNHVITENSIHQLDKEEEFLEKFINPDDTLVQIADKKAQIHAFLKP
jgi:hypothetical protein